ncbi:MAG: HAD-IA family hydrolase [Anaerolineaceae bacterium]
MILHEQNVDEALFSNIPQVFEEAFELNQPMLEYIKKLSKSVKTGLSSNYSNRLRSMLEDDLHIAHLFHTIIISSEVGMVKPDEQIYHIALSRLNVLPQEAIFVDDRIENIEGAARVGMHALHFQNNEQTISEINQLVMES